MISEEIAYNAQVMWTINMVIFVILEPFYCIERGGQFISQHLQFLHSAQVILV